MMLSQITIQQIQQVMELIEKRTGIMIHNGLRDTLNDLLRQVNTPDYLEKLIHSRETDPLWQSLIAALTIGETYFLRDHAHFELLRMEILPELIKQRRAENNKTLHIWSVGCASGEEPYSLAIILSELLPDIAGWDVQVIGSDLNSEALHNARRGVYRKWAFRHTDAEFQQRYFDPTPKGLAIKPYIRQMVTFRHANLFNDRLPNKFDLVLCRNVFIYFSAVHTRRAEQLLFEALHPGGWLMLGHAEVLHHNQERWITHLFPARPIYQKPLPLADSQRVLAQKHKYRTATIPRLVEYHDIVLALQQEDYPQAALLLQEFLKLQPDHAPAHLLLAYTHANRSAWAAAHEQIATALRLDPLFADAHYLKAMLIIEEGQETRVKVFRVLEAALYCQRNHPLASFVLGNMHAHDGNMPRAVSHWRNALKAITSLREDSPVSDISQITAGQLQAHIKQQLAGWQA